MKLQLGFLALGDVVADAQVTSNVSFRIVNRINENAGDQMLAIFSDEGPLSLFGSAVAGKLRKYAVALNRMS